MTAALHPSGRATASRLCVVTFGENGLLVPTGDVAAFRDAPIHPHEHSDRHGRPGANACSRVVVLCDLEAFTRETRATVV